MKSNRKPILVLNRTDKLGGIHKVELFKPYDSLYVIHRHSLVEQKELANVLGFKRKFKEKYYCMQEIVLYENEVIKFIEGIKELHKNKSL